MNKINNRQNGEDFEYTFYLLDWIPLVECLKKNLKKNSIEKITSHYT